MKDDLRQRREALGIKVDRTHMQILQMKSDLISAGGTDTLDVNSCKAIANWSGNESIDLPDGMTGIVGVHFKKDRKHIQYFRSREELNEFVAQLNEFADRAWG